VSPNIQVPPPPLVTGARVTPRQTQDTISILPPQQHEQQIHPQHQLITTFNNMNINDVRFILRVPKESLISSRYKKTFINKQNRDMRKLFTKKSVSRCSLSHL